MKKSAIVCSLILSLAVVTNPVFAGDIVVIVNKSNTNTVDKDTVAKIYKGHFKNWPSGGEVADLTLPDDNPETGKFCNDIIGKSLSHMKQVWSQMMFSGQALPPKQVASDEEMKKTVNGNVNAIGFIKASSLDDSVKAAVK